MSDLRDFFGGLSVFVTGGTGFMGKVLIEKLLRSTEVAKIYVLVRPKRGKDVATRLEELLEDAVFDRLRSEKIRFKHRIVSISGDCSQSGLGVNIYDRETLRRDVDVVFHAAATVRFDERLPLAYRINVAGTKAVIDLCREMNKLKSLVHVSTAYSNCYLETIGEKFYDIPVGCEELEMMLEKMNEEEVMKATESILGNWPNTYTFTKALAEDILRTSSKGLPVAVFRPAIVISTSREPFPGWIDNIYGPTGACAAVGSGLLRILHCDKDTIANIVPVDSCVAALLAVAWDAAQGERGEVKIFNYVSSEENPITWGEYHALNRIAEKKYPFLNTMWAVRFRTTTNVFLYQVQKFLLHIVPAVLFDGVCVCFAQKPRLLNMYKKIHKLSDVIAYFCNRNWHFETHNMRQLWKRMSEADREAFPFDIRQVLWIKYFHTYLLGIRQHLIKDPIETLEIARRKRQRLEVLHSVFKFLLYFLVFQVVWNHVGVVYRSMFG